MVYGVWGLVLVGTSCSSSPVAFPNADIAATEVTDRGGRSAAAVFSVRMPVHMSTAFLGAGCVQG